MDCTRITKNGECTTGGNTEGWRIFIWYNLPWNWCKARSILYFWWPQSWRLAVTMVLLHFSLQFAVNLLMMKIWQYKIVQISLELYNNYIYIFPYRYNFFVESWNIPSSFIGRNYIWWWTHRHDAKMLDWRPWRKTWLWTNKDNIKTSEQVSFAWSKNKNFKLDLKLFGSNVTFDPRPRNI